MGDMKDEAQKALAEARDVRGVYKHRKGGTYVLYSVTVDEESLETMVHYYSVERGSRWTRPLRVWTEPVEGHPRFWKVRDATVSELLKAADIYAGHPT